MNAGASIVIRRAFMAALVGAIGFGAWRIHEVNVGDGFGRAEQQLAERVDQYVELRRTEDWAHIYDLVDPLHRETIDLGEFLKVHAHGVLELLSIEAGTGTIDTIQRTAKVPIKSSARMNPDKLPAPFRRGFRIEPGDEEHLTQAVEHEMDWVWRDGQWYYQLERELLTGRSSFGQQIELLGGADDTGNGEGEG